MDYNNQNNPYQNPYNRQDYYPQPAPHPGSRQSSQRMESLAVILGAVSLVGGSCLYISLLCGAIAIILGLLSKGGKLRISSRARTGIILGCIGLVVSILVYSVAIYNLFQTYGSWDGILQNYSDTYGIDYNSLFSGQ